MRIALATVLCLVAPAIALGAERDERSTGKLESVLQEKIAQRYRRTVALGAFFEATGDWETAATHYEAARRFRDDDPSLLTRLLRYYRTRGEVRKQVPIYQALVRLQPTSIGWLRELGSCYFRLGQREKAEATWRGILDAHSVRTSGVQYLAQIYQKHGLHEKAVEAYKEGLALAPRDEEMRFALAQAQTRGGDGLAALVTLAPLNREHDRPRGGPVHKLRAQALKAMDLTHGEGLVLQRLLEEQPPQSAAGLAWRLARAFERAGQWTRAAAFFRRVAAEEPDTVRGRVAAETARRLSEQGTTETRRARRKHGEEQPEGGTTDEHR
jgi:tetratricopeptide (TPR) repeat protein